MTSATNIPLRSFTAIHPDMPEINFRIEYVRKNLFYIKVNTTSDPDDISVIVLKKSAFILFYNRFF